MHVNFSLQCCKLWFSNLVNLSYRVMCNIRLDLKIFLYSIIQKGNIGRERDITIWQLKLNIVQWIRARIHCLMLQTRNNRHCMNTSLFLDSHCIKDVGNLSSNAIQCPWKSKVFSNYSKDKICKCNQNCIKRRNYIIFFSEGIYATDRRNKISWAQRSKDI